jgi:phosphoglycerate dehydrogenase-like enzyme
MTGMYHLVLEQDAFMRMFVPMLDPSAPKEFHDAVADFFAHDEPDFDGWLTAMRNRIPGLFPARVSLAQDQDHFRELLPTADACLIESLTFGPQELARAPKIAVVQKYGALTRNIDLAACAARNVRVCVQRRRVNVSLAELVMALLLGMGKHVIELNHVIDEPRLNAAGYQIRPYDKRYTGGSNFARIPGLRTMFGKTLGIIGFGEVGREIARRAQAFEMRIVYTQRTRLSDVEEGFLGATYLPLRELMAASDYLTINLPVTPQTTRILGPTELAALKPGAFLANVARPELIDRAALFDALDSGRLAGYGTDTWFERPARSDDPVFDYKNVVVLPHTAIADRRNALLDIEEMFMKMSDALIARSAGA